jgi:hypothetical protein
VTCSIASINSGRRNGRMHLAMFSWQCVVRNCGQHDQLASTERVYGPVALGQRELLTVS